jgi:arylsulfatase A-like enzyme
LIFFLSDNGFLWGEHGLTRKAAPYTPSVQIPFLMRPPGGIPPLEDQRLVANIDIAPTVLQTAGVLTTEPAMDGRSLLSDNARDRILLEYYDESNAPRKRFQAPSWASLRTASYQYVEYYGTNGSTVNFREYYDLDQDPYQLVNLLGDDDTSNDPDPVTLLLLSQQLSRDRSCTGTSGPQACP